MKTKIIDGKSCTLRDVVYSDFGAETETDKKVAILKSSEEFRGKGAREELFKDRVYSWTNEENPYDYYEGSEDDMNLDRLFSDLEDDMEAELQDKEYAAPGQLNMRLVVLKRPLHIQLKDLYREHNRFYKAQKNLKPKEVDLLIEDFRFELHRIIAKAKDIVVEDGGNMDTILKISSITSGGDKLQKSLRKLTIVFKRVEQAYKKFGYIPRPYQTTMNDELSIVISNFIMDVYGPELERRKLESSELSNATGAKL